MWSQMRILCDGLLQTLQRYDYDGKLEHSFTAHPKVDSESGAPTQHSLAADMLEEGAT